MSKKIQTRNDAEFLRKAREALGMSQEELAEYLGMTQGNLSWYETGRTKRLPKLVREKVADMLAVQKLAPSTE